jgi:hypothetical protein
MNERQEKIFEYLKKKSYDDKILEFTEENLKILIEKEHFSKQLTADFYGISGKILKKHLNKFNIKSVRTGTNISTLIFPYTKPFKNELDQEKYEKLEKKLKSKLVSMDLEFSKETIENFLFAHFLTLDEIALYFRPRHISKKIIFKHLNLWNINVSHKKELKSHQYLEKFKEHREKLEKYLESNNVSISSLAFDEKTLRFLHFEMKLSLRMIYLCFIEKGITSISQIENAFKEWNIAKTKESINEARMRNHHILYIEEKNEEDFKKLIGFLESKNIPVDLEFNKKNLKFLVEKVNLSCNLLSLYFKDQKISKKRVTKSISKWGINVTEEIKLKSIKLYNNVFIGKDNFNQLHLKNVEFLYDKEFWKENFIKNGYFLRDECTDFFNFQTRSTANNHKRLLGFTEKKKIDHHKKESEIYEWLKAKYSGVKIICCEKQAIYPKELDFYFPDLNLAIEFNGLLWHSFGKSKTRGFLNNFDKERMDHHLYKTILCENKNIMLLQIFENEWYNSESREKWKEYISCLIESKPFDYSWFSDENESEIRIDRRFSDGKFLGLELKGKMAPTAKWVDLTTGVPDNEPFASTENLYDSGFRKIYDCGSLVYKLNRV